MKVAILSESSADEAALRIIIDGILETQTHPEASYPLRSRGWPAVLNVLPAMIKHHAGEAAWMRDLRKRVQPRGYIAKLKRDVYGTDRPISELAKRRAVEEADRRVQNLNELKKRFPNGFGPFARSVREWS